jgi:hypothetical protein
MAYTKIATVDVATATASISFTSIPGTYTDLFIITNEKSTTNANTLNTLAVNTATTYHSVYAGNRLGVAAGSSANNVANGTYGYQGALSTNTFANNQIYITNYSDSLNKTIWNLSTGVTDDMSVATNVWASAHEITATTTAAITSITLAMGSGNFAVGSNFNLYGILKGSGGGTIA